jgi:hypothetical protein
MNLHSFPHFECLYGFKLFAMNVHSKKQQMNVHHSNKTVWRCIDFETIHSWLSRPHLIHFALQKIWLDSKFDNLTCMLFLSFCFPLLGFVRFARCLGSCKTKSFRRFWTTREYHCNCKRHFALWVRCTHFYVFLCFPYQIYHSILRCRVQLRHFVCLHARIMQMMCKLCKFIKIFF